MALRIPDCTRHHPIESLMIGECTVLGFGYWRGSVFRSPIITRSLMIALGTLIAA